jgi:transcriptional antiterminator RfaH
MSTPFSPFLLSLPPEGSSCWYALAVRARQEDRAADNLKAWGIPTLAPKIDIEAMGRQKLLFPGYIFARFELAHMAQKIRFTRGISHIVSFGGKPAEVADEIIAAISNRIRSDGAISLGRSLRPGDSVVITEGPLRDFEGVFEEELSDGERVRILLDTVAYTARMEISRYNLRKRSPLCKRIS